MGTILFSVAVLAQVEHILGWNQYITESPRQWWKHPTVNGKIVYSL